MKRAAGFRRVAVDDNDTAIARASMTSGIVGYLRFNREGSIETANRTLEAWLGLPTGDRLCGRMFSSIVSSDCQWQEWASAPRPMTCRLSLRGAEGRLIPVKAEVRPADAEGRVEIRMIEDLANEMIARVASLEASLTLTAGTVHDVNNVLTVLCGNLFLLTESARDQPELCEQARRARNAAARGSTLLRELLTYNREADGEANCISPANHVLALKPLLLRTVRASGADHELKIRVHSNAGSVMASAARFESVVINLVINARDALGARGRIHVHVRNVHLGEERAQQLGLKADTYVCVTIIDNGSGIPAKYLHRVTEPLFSTKRKDRGSGLGLAMVRHFAESCGGALRIDSVEGRGTRVRLWMPCTEKLAETTANMTLPLSTLPGGDERLLLLSRDGDVRSSIQQILETLGYSVVVAASVEDADRVLAGQPEPALVISDRSADSLRAEQRWLNELKEAYPVIRHVALLQAGARVEDAAPDCDSHVHRPVTVPELAQSVRNALETTNV